MPVCEPWPIDTSCQPGWDALPADTRATAQDWATGILDALTGRQFHQCPVVVRPCGERCGSAAGYLTFPVDGASGLGAPWMVPYVSGGVWRNCHCAGPCACRARCEAYLAGPVAEILEVKVDGSVVEPSSYQRVNGSILVRTDGECWPECQDLNLPDTEPGTWSVRMRPGQMLPRIGEIAAGQLAAEYAKSCSGDASCALPQQLTSLTRSGIDVQVMDPSTLLDDGLTGLADVDLFIRAVNPKRRTRGSRVLSPDLPRQRTMTP